jgi:hypothetical protein
MDTEHKVISEFVPAVGNPYSHVTEANDGNMVQNPKRTEFVETRLTSRQKGNFRLSELKIRNWYKD